MISPDVFIQLAEDTGDIVPMTRWLMNRVGEELGARLRDDAGLPHRHQPGAGPLQRRPDLSRGRRPRRRGRGGFPLARLQFEITERALVDEERCKTVIDRPA